MKKRKIQTLKTPLIVLLAFFFIFSSRFSTAQEQKDAKPPQGSSPAAEPSIGNADELTGKCLAVPADMRLKFAMEYYDYADYKTQGVLNGVANCQAYAANKQELCETFNLVTYPSGAPNPGFKADSCKKNTEIFNTSRKAAESKEACSAEMGKYCEKNDLCSRMTDWGAIKCKCDILSELLCEIAGSESAGKCVKMSKNSVLKKNFPKLYFPAMISECQAVINGQPTRVIGKGATRLMDLLFLTSLFKGDKWNLFEEATDMESLNIDESFVWYWKYIYYAKRPCGYKLDSAWESFCGGYPQIYAVKKSAEDKFRKTDFSGSGTPNSDK